MLWEGIAFGEKTKTYFTFMSPNSLLFPQDRKLPMAALIVSSGLGAYKATRECGWVLDTTEETD